MKHPVRLLPLAALALVAAGCSAVNPITTQDAYDASDGFSIEFGDVTGLNLIVITEELGSPAVLIGSLYNSGDEDVQVAASIDGEGIVTVDVPAGTLVKLGGEEGEAHITGTSTAAPGSLQEITVQTDEAGHVAEFVPVLDGTLPEYAVELDSL
ncbi:hypothetical protein QQX09_06385 [Demequina sp. SYSU T00192]|uniref:DNA modification methylase n=1 Tax=Demequina litoralis TaxID=3051660 RepID=A0ABT8G8L2_9MICO|nr:hypothetical protein [Demequina sp. SYSU T00192]MDN4475480.1 hypothetical protein [Demequina sp. SYSU T00192]